MNDWISFQGCIIPLQWGSNTYTVLPLPDEVAQDLARSGAKRVEIEINDTPFNMALTKAPVIDQTFVYTGKETLTKAEVEPGDVLEVRLRKTDPNHVETPNDVQNAVMQAGLSAQWTATTPGKKRAALHQIESAKRPETRSKRIAALLADLATL